MAGLGVFCRLRGRSSYDLFFRARRDMYKRLNLLIYRVQLKRTNNVSAAARGETGHIFFSPTDLPRTLVAPQVSFPTGVEQIRDKAERPCANDLA